MGVRTAKLVLDMSNTWARSGVLASEADEGDMHVWGLVGHAVEGYHTGICVRHGAASMLVGGRKRGERLCTGLIQTRDSKRCIVHTIIQYCLYMSTVHRVAGGERTKWTGSGPEVDQSRAGPEVDRSGP